MIIIEENNVKKARKPNGQPIEKDDVRGLGIFNETYIDKLFQSSPENIEIKIAEVMLRGTMEHF